MLSRALSRSGAVAAAGSLVRHASSKAAGVSARVTAVLGSQWGDEGKGKLADVLAKNYDIVARFNGGANAGHTVVVDGKKFAFHLLPCGLIYPHTQNLLGNGTVIHFPSLFEELAPLSAAGIEWDGRLKISDRAHVLFDFHKKVDGLMEERLKQGGQKIIGTTKQGIGPAYTSKAMRNAVRVGHLLHREALHTRLRRLIEDTRRMYDVEIDAEEEVAKVDAVAERVRDMIVDGQHMIHAALQGGQRIIAEGANAAMLDMDFGTYPYVTSSTTTAGGVCTGLGIPPSRLEAVVGVVKAYTTRVGGGPFPTELTDERGGGDRPLNSEGTDVGLHLQKVGAEVGVTTGRKRRCGWFDAVVVAYSHALNGFTSLNLTKLDVLDELETVKIATGYRVHGKALPQGAFPSTLEDLSAAEVDYITMPGWQSSTRGITSFAALPANARAYVKRIEEVTGVPVAYIGTGPGRNEMITRGFKMA